MNRLTEEKYKELIQTALLARRKAYVPYSQFQVGAALLTTGGKIYSGCNIENASFGAANCAERTAFFKAVSEGEKDFSAIAIVGGHCETDNLDYCSPCGICRQVMAEFCDPSTFEVVLARREEEYQVYRLEELLPHSFTAKDLEKSKT